LRHDARILEAIDMQPTQSPMSTPGAQSSLPQRGEVFDGRYRIDGVIGIDGMGALLAATRLESNERVAIKVLLPDAAPNGAIGRSTLQGIGSSKLRGDFVARSAEAGIYQGRPYLVLEYPAGMDPRELVDQGGIHRSRPPAPPPAAAFPPARAVPMRASERLAAPAPARAAAYSLRTSVPTVPMRSAAPGYLLAGMALVAICGTAGWAVWHQGRALHEAEARTEAPTLAPTVKLPPVPTLPPAPSADSVVTTTGAVVSSGSTQVAPTAVSAVTPPAPAPPPPAAKLAASPAPAPPPHHHHHAHPKPTPAAQSSLTDNPYAAPSASSASASSPAASTDPGAGTNLFDVRK
jgi:hypothetical protein